jgi:hypothetical protein
VKNQAYHFEIEDLITQFITAFDDCVIKRFAGDRVSKDQISVRYVYAPKQRVIYDIVNAGKNLTLPAVAISIASVSRDASRVFNKLDGFHYPSTTVAAPAAFSNSVGSPVPVNIAVNMSIIAKYQADIEQIISNFAAYSNPYIVLVWKIPAAFNLAQTYEIRSEVEWSGNISLNYPGDMAATDKYRLTADTSFTIKGWLFPQAPVDPVKNIFFIDANFYATRTLSGNPLNMSYAKYDDYTTLSAADFNGFTESIRISAAPTITDVYYSSNIGIGARMDSNVNITPFLSGGVVTVFGKRFLDTTQVALCSNNLSSFYGSLTALNFTYYDTISCYLLQDYTILNDNIMTINIPAIYKNGSFNFVVINEAGYDTTYSASNTFFVYTSGGADNLLYELLLDDSNTSVILDDNNSVLQLS